jgi:hypothetical protein
MSNPDQHDLDAAHQTLKYLNATYDYGIGYRSKGNRLPYLYADSDDGADETRRSCAGYMSVIADGPLYWKSAMIDALSLSSCESEIRAINMAKEPIKEILKLKNWMTDIENALALTSSPNSHSILTDVPTEILEDNKACIDWSKHTTNSTKLRHLERDLKWIQKFVQEGSIRLVHIPTTNQIADIFTKALYSVQFCYLRDRFLFRFKT